MRTRVHPVAAPTLTVGWRFRLWIEQKFEMSSQRFEK